MIAKLIQFLTTLAVNAVPALGWFIGDWSAGTTLAVYWFENVAASLFIALRIMIQSRVAPRRGHYQYEGSREGRRGAPSGKFLSGFLPVSLVFSAGHAIFLAALIFLMTKNGKGAEVRLDFRELMTGCGLVLLFLAADFLVDLFTIKKRSFRWIETLANRNLGRVMIVHMTIIIGMAAGGMSGGAWGFFAVFVALKTLNDLSILLPQYDPAEAPKWLCTLMDRVPNISRDHPERGRTFAEFWRNGKREEAERLRKNDLPCELPAKKT